MSIRLNKLLAERGLGARRKCDELISSGVVRVNGEVVTELGTRVEPERDRVEVRGRPLPQAQRPIVYMLHKPVGVISTLSDPEGRRTLQEFMPPGARLFPVGRLDADTTGLILLTNDGDLAHRLTHPSFEVPRVYRVQVSRAPVREPALRALRDGVQLEDGRTAPAKVRRLAHDRLELTIHEGRKRQVRRMCEAVGHPVVRLSRVAFGPLGLGDLELGGHRRLSRAEVERLKRSAR